MKSTVAIYKVGRTAADAVLVGRGMKRSKDLRVIRHPEVIVTAEVKAGVAVDAQLGPLGTVNDQPRTVQTGRPALFQFRRERIKTAHADTAES